jgi:predicted aspartyl protease
MKQLAYFLSILLICGTDSSLASKPSSEIDELTKPQSLTYHPPYKRHKNKGGYISDITTPEERQKFQQAHKAEFEEFARTCPAVYYILDLSWYPIEGRRWLVKDYERSESETIDFKIRTYEPRTIISFLDEIIQGLPKQPSLIKIPNYNPILLQHLLHTYSSEIEVGAVSMDNYIKDGLKVLQHKNLSINKLHIKLHADDLSINQTFTPAQLWKIIKDHKTYDQLMLSIEVNEEHHCLNGPTRFIKGLQRAMGADETKLVGLELDLRPIADKVSVNAFLKSLRYYFLTSLTVTSGGMPGNEFKFGLDDCRIIFDALCHHEFLRKLHLQCFHKEKDSDDMPFAYSVKSFLKNNNMVSDLSLGVWGLSKEAADEVADGLLGSSSITTLDQSTNLKEYIESTGQMDAIQKKLRENQIARSANSPAINILRKLRSKGTMVELMDNCRDEQSEKDKYGRWYIPCVVNERCPYRFKHDTGCDFTSIRYEECKRFGIDTSNLRFNKLTSTVNGKTFVATARINLQVSNFLKIFDLEVFIGQKNCMEGPLLGRDVIQLLKCNTENNILTYGPML